MSPIDKNGHYAAGVNKNKFRKATDIIRVVDHVNGDVTAEATVIVSWSCFIVQMYGDDSKEAALMRSFRDSVLSQIPEGQAIIDLYYRFSPVIMMALESDDELKQEVKALVDEILPLIKSEAK